MIKTSIIIPIYNREKYLKECIESVVAQTIFNEIELILVNDGSTDNSEDICLEYVKTYSNIKYFYQENKGVSFARNLGLSKAQGEYVYFLDSDDTINNIFIESAYDNAILNNSDIVIVGTNLSPLLKILPPDYVYIFATWQGFYAKEFLYRNNIRFNSKISNGEDSLISFQATTLAKNISCEHNCIYFYRKHSNSLMKNLTNFSIFKIMLLEILESLDIFYSQNLKNTKLQNNILKFIANTIFFLCLQSRFQYKQKKELFSYIYFFIIKLKLQPIKIELRKFPIKYNFLFFIFNLIYFNSKFFRNYFIDFNLKIQS